MIGDFSVIDDNFTSTWGDFMMMRDKEVVVLAKCGIECPIKLPICISIYLIYLHSLYQYSKFLYLSMKNVDALTRQSSSKRVFILGLQFPPPFAISQG